MDVHLLGPIEARLDGRPIELGARKQRAVLAMLALQVGHTVSADHLANGLWGERPPRSAAKMVQLYVSQLRRLVAGDGAEIVTRGRGYELRLVGGEVDAVRFERLVEELRPRDALALWRGEPLSDVADEPFAAAEIRRLDDLRVRAAELAIEADLTAGRHVEVLAEIEGLLATQPLRERLHAQRMLALYRSGRQAEALQAYREARALLVERIGVEPGGELQLLQNAILAQDAKLDLPRTSTVRPTSASRPPPRRRALPVLAVTAVLLLLGTALAVSGIAGPDGLAGIEIDHLGRIDPDGDRIVEQFPVGRGPAAVVAGAGSLWVANALDGTVSRVDRKRGPVTISVGGAPSGLAFGAGSLWVADSDSGRVAQVDPGANKVAQDYDAGNAPRALAVADGALWVVSEVDGTVRRIDLRRVLKTRSIRIGARPTAIAAGAGAVWVASEEAGTVTRIDPRSGTLVRAIPVGNGPSAIATGEGAAWVVNRDDGTLARIDPATNAVSWAVHVGRDPTAVAVGNGAVWVAGGEERKVSRVDPRAPRVLDTIAIGSSPAAIAAASGAVWTAGVAPQASHRGGTLRVRIPSDVRAGIPIDWLHPLAGWATLHLTSLAYDGLVGYRRVGGVAGATLVGALATSAPAPSRDGRTYVFTLRPGLRFSDGSPVRPDDFRASIERMLAATRHRAPPYYLGIVGAQRCIDRPDPCDLSAGIQTDRRARTIAIHLNRPDADFLHKLTNPLAFVVPAGTPISSSGDAAPPGTGPYRVAGWHSLRGGRLVRNPYFSSRPAQARPPGFVQEIDVRVVHERGVEAQIADVQRGAADLLVLADPFGSRIATARVSALIARSPGQIHSAPAGETDWMFVNVRRRPFDHVRVRRALNYAVDRERIVALAGGSAFAAPTCQIVPAGVPGYVPYCPYTANAAAGRPWSAPDVARARELVAASGTAGERIVVYVPAFRRQVGRYVTRVLDELGFRASLRVLSLVAYFAAVYDPRSHIQIGFMGWNLDYMSASSFLRANFTCVTEAERDRFNVSRFCDPLLARLVDRAQAADAAGVWAEADRRITDLAPAVPLTNRRSLVLVSNRVGNVQTHPFWFTLLDQLWVR